LEIAAGGLLATTVILMVRRPGPVEDEHRVISLAAVVLGLTDAGIFIVAGLSCGRGRRTSWATICRAHRCR
jgi:hypothetical protein